MLTSICVVNDTGRRGWRGQCGSDPEQIERAVRGHAGDDALVGLDTGPMTSWLVHELRNCGINMTCLDVRHESAALKMQMNLAEASTTLIIPGQLGDVRGLVAGGGDHPAERAECAGGRFADAGRNNAPPMPAESSVPAPG